MEMITNFSNELHYLARIESYINGKVMKIVRELNILQGRLTAKRVNLHTAYRNFKIQQRTATQKQSQQEMKATMLQVGQEIQHIDAAIKIIIELKKRITNEARQDISTLSIIGKQAENKS